MMTSRSNRSSGPPAIVTDRVLTKILDLWLNYEMTPESIAAILQKEDGATVAPGTVKTKIYENQGRIKGTAMVLIEANELLDALPSDFQKLAKEYAAQRVALKRRGMRTMVRLMTVADLASEAAEEAMRGIKDENGELDILKGQNADALTGLAVKAIKAIPPEFLTEEIRAPGSDKVPTLSQALAQVRALPSPEKKD